MKQVPWGLSPGQRSEQQRAGLEQEKLLRCKSPTPTPLALILAPAQEWAGLFELPHEPACLGVRRKGSIHSFTRELHGIPSELCTDARAHHLCPQRAPCWREGGRLISRDGCVTCVLRPDGREVERLREPRGGPWGTGEGGRGDRQRGLHEWRRRKSLAFLPFLQNPQVWQKIWVRA